MLNGFISIACGYLLGSIPSAYIVISTPFFLLALWKGEGSITLMLYAVLIVIYVSLRSWTKVKEALATPGSRLKKTIEPNLRSPAL